MPPTTYISRGGRFSLAGLADAGANWDRPPDLNNDRRWRTWPEFITVPKSYRGSGQPVQVRLCFEEALTLVHRCVGPGANPGCDPYFLKLGAGRAPGMRRSLSDLLGYRLIFYRSGATHVADDFRATGGAVAVEEGEVLFTNNVDGLAIISIAAWGVRSPVSLAATIVHELAHCAGAPGRPSDADWAAMTAERRANYYAAENALLVCGFHQQHRPEIYGEIQDRFARAMRVRTA